MGFAAIVAVAEHGRVTRAELDAEFLEELVAQGLCEELAKGRNRRRRCSRSTGGTWPRKWVQRICKAAGVPKVTAHAMRGLHSTPAVDKGITSHAVAAALDHESFKTTAESYAQRDAGAGAQQKRVLGVLAGGKIAS
jgi:integrase